MARRRALDWVLIVVLSGVWGVLFVRAVGEGIRTGRGRVLVGVSSAAAPDTYPLVRTTEPADLHRGDQIEAVDGEDLAGASALRFHDSATRAARAHGSTSLRIRRDGAVVDVRVPLSSPAWWWTPLLSSCATLLVAVVLLVRAPGWYLARRNLAALGCLAMAEVITESGRAATTAFETIFSAAMIPLAGFLLTWNAQEFTLSARPVPKLQRALAILVGISLGFFSLVKLHLPHTPGQFEAVLIGQNVFMVGVFVAGLTRAYRRSDALERRQIRWLTFGFYVTSVGVGLADVLSLVAPHVWVRVLTAITTSATPVGILVSVIGYRWLDVDRLISAATSYTILGLAVLGTALAVLPGVSQVTAPLLGVGPATLQWLLTLGLVLAAIPSHSFLWPRIDRRMFVERNRRMLGFAHLLDEIGSYDSAEELIRMAGKRVDALLEPESIVIYARTDRQFTPVLARGRAKSESSFQTSSPLVRTLEQRGRPLWADSAELDAFDRAVLETLGVELIVPIRGADGVAAFACLGRKRSGDIYTPQEVAHLGAVASRCSEVLSRLHAEPPAETARQVFRREGDFWTIASAGKKIRLRDMRGLHYLATLLREPGREFAATDLVKFGNGLPWTRPAEAPDLSVVSGLGDAGGRLDARARAAYRERLTEIEAERAEAERNGDLGRLGRASEEREALLAELVAAARGRRAASHAERARVAVTKAIGSALERIAERHPEVGTHLSATIRRGYLCAYVPDPRIPSDWQT
jgi:hypothetical protein